MQFYILFVYGAVKERVIYESVKREPGKVKAGGRLLYMKMAPEHNS